MTIKVLALVIVCQDYTLVVDFIDEYWRQDMKDRVLREERFQSCEIKETYFYLNEETVKKTCKGDAK